MTMFKAGVRRDPLLAHLWTSIQGSNQSGSVAIEVKDEQCGHSPCPAEQAHLSPSSAD